MNKSELIDAVAAKLGDDVSKKVAGDAVEAVLDCIAAGVRSDSGGVQLIGFGSFKISHRAARKGRNPKTGEEMDIPASKSVKFSPSSKLKATL
ncbi:MAG: HU family DNA-binding protein [Verrucomicrobiota bacterium]